MAYHFIVDTEQIKSGKIAITGEDFGHLTRVLRLKKGDEITATDGSGNLYKCLLEEIYQSEALGKIISVELDQTESPIEMVLLQGLPKGDKLELIIQKTTELGISRVVPVAMKRSVVQLSTGKAKERTTRWQRIAREAAKQCRRSQVPVVEYATDLREVLDSLNEDALILLPWEGENTQGIKEVLISKETSERKQIAIIIGPEGGFDEQEIELAKQYNAVSVSLGPRILRTETAAIVVTALVMYQLGDLGGMSIG